MVFVCFETNAAHGVLFFFMYVLSEMQYRDWFPGFSHKRLIFFLNLSFCMVCFKCSTESSFLLFVCFESNAIQRLFSWFLP